MGRRADPALQGLPRADAAGLPTQRARRAPVASNVDALLRHNAHLLRERRAPPRARLHDYCRRRARAAHAAAWRGGLLPHGYRRARRAGHPGGREARHHPARAGRPQCGALQGARRTVERDQRLLHPHHRSGARPGGRRGRAAHPRQRPRLRGHVRGLVLPPLRGLQDGVGARGGQPLSHPQDRARAGARGQLVLQAVLVSGAAGASLRRAARLRHSAEPLQRGALLHQERPARPVTQPGPAEVGSAGAVGPQPGHLRVDRRAPQLLLGEHKMSKSLGNVIEPFQVADIYGADALRFYVLREVTFGSDGEVSPEGFETRYTTELANEYGNLANRTLAMIERYRDGVVPTPASSATLATEFDGLAGAVRERLDGLELTAALDEIWRRIKRLNRYVQEEEPWQLAKDEAQAERLDEILYTVAEGLRVVSVLLHPFMPESAERLLAALGREDLSLELARFGAVSGGATIGELGQLFPRIEAEAPAA